MRAFLALNLPDEVKADISGVVRELKRRTSGLRWIEEGGLHLTLRFLGEIPAETFAAVGRAVSEGFGSTGLSSLYAEGVGAFPDPGRPRVVWVGLGGDLPALGRLVAALNGRLLELGIPPEPRPFSAHVTVGRAVRGERAANLVRAAGSFAGWRSAGWSPEEVALYESRLLPGGAVHTKAAAGRIGP